MNNPNGGYEVQPSLVAEGKQDGGRRDGRCPGGSPFLDPAGLTEPEQEQQRHERQHDDAAGHGIYVVVEGAGRQPNAEQSGKQHGPERQPREHVGCSHHCGREQIEGARLAEGQLKPMYQEEACRTPTTAQRRDRQQIFPPPKLRHAG